MEKNLVFLSAQIEDLPAVLGLQKRAFEENARRHNDFNIQPLTQTLEDLKKEFRDHTILIAKSNDRVIASVRGKISKRTVYIQKLIVDPDYQNRGVGKQMFVALERSFPDADRFELYTAVADEKNIHIYSNFGYIPFRTEVISGIEFVFMEKIL
ncbi:MAG: GNAT family N-acetyltransferase [Spirochaetes bacterium]|nr:GNAT family N-acetyltransferase [Spirochaetota bacterium]